MQTIRPILSAGCEHLEYVSERVSVWEDSWIRKYKIINVRHFSEVRYFTQVRVRRQGCRGLQEDNSAYNNTCFDKSKCVNGKLRF